MASISTPESSLQEKLSRSEEIRDIDRAALAQKFSVTRKLFETKMMRAEGGGGQVLKAVTARGNKGIVCGNVEGENGRGGGNQLEKEESGIRKHTAADGFNKDKSMNPPVIYISSLRPQAQASLSRHPEYPVSDGQREESNNSVTGQQTEEEGADSTNLDLCLTPEQPVRAELVDIKNESSESDENEEEKKKDHYRLKDKEDNDMNRVEDLVDDVFEEPSMETTPESYRLENRVDITTGEIRPVASSEGHQDDSESRREKVEQVNEQCEGKRTKQNKQFVARDEQKSAEMLEEEEEKEKPETAGEESAGWREGGVEQRINDECGVKGCSQSQEEERTEKEKKREREEVPALKHEVKHVACGGGGDGAGGKEDETESATVCGIENKALVYDEEERSPRHDLGSSLRTGNQLLVEYQEIPGVPDQDEEDVSDLAKRRVRFSSSPIKVRKTTQALPFSIRYSLYGQSRI